MMRDPAPGAGTPSTGARTALAAILAVVVAACAGAEPTTSPPGEGAHATVRSTAVSTAASTAAGGVPQDVGPLAGLTWPGGPAPAGALLYDDGEALWSVTLDGERTLVWDHPQVVLDPLGLAASAGGEQVAMSVNLPFGEETDPFSVLYLLDRDGSVRVVDAPDRFRSVEYPVFMRPPTEHDSAPLLYWLRFGGNIETATGRMDTKVLVETPGGPVAVTVPLRHHEGVFALHAYPGASTFTLSLFRHNDVPTRLEILRSYDYQPSADETSLQEWSHLQPEANTDIFTGVAWLTSSRYVIPVAQEFFLDRYSLRLFEVGCEYRGSHVVYEGPDIGIGYADFPWPLLPGGPDRVLVLTRADEQRLVDGAATEVPWTAVDVHTGELHPTGALWSAGAWTWVSPGDATPPPFDPPVCNDWEWTYP